jgi:CheY-like chemotaxis protein
MKKSFLQSASILLIGSKPSHRSGLRKILVDMGADNHNIEVASDYGQASSRLSGGPVQIVFSDEDLDTMAETFELLKLHQKNNPETFNRLFILTAGDISSIHRTDFSMKGGDLIISKPYTIGSFTSAFNELLQKRAAMTKDDKVALAVEDALRINDRDKAVEFVKAIKKPDSKPAFDSQGLIHQFDKDYLSAYQQFFSSAEKKVDVKSLVNLVSNGIKSKKYTELDSFVETWIKHHPLYSESIPDITRVVLYNKKFHLLKEMSIDDQSARIPMAAGMVVASSFYLDRGDKQLSIEFAKKGIEFSGPKRNIMLKAFEILIKAGALAEAVKVFENLKLQSLLSEDQSFLKTIKDLLQLK